MARAYPAARSGGGGDWKRPGVARPACRTMRRTLLSLTGAAALALTLSACGDSGSDDAASDGCTPVDGTFTVHAKDALKFDAEEYTADAGCIEVTYTNDGS